MLQCILGRVAVEREELSAGTLQAPVTFLQVYIGTGVGKGGGYITRQAASEFTQKVDEGL